MNELLSIYNGDIKTAYFDLPCHLTHRTTPLLCVHGFTGASLDFVSQAPALAEQVRVVAYDQRGHGHSSNKGPYTLAQLATDLVTFMDELQIPTCHVLGHSLGGMVALRALLQHPERFRSAVLMDTAAHGIELIPQKIQSQLNSLVQDQGCGALLQGMRSMPQRSVVQRGIDYLGEQEHWRRIREKLENMDPNAFVALSGELRDQISIAEQLDSIQSPVTVLVGADDAPFRPPARQLAELLPNCQLQLIANAAHSPQYENADEWLTTIFKHLTWVDE